MKFELYKDKVGEWRWRLVVDNGNMIANSGEGYKNKTDCEHGINLVKSATSSTLVVEL